MSFQLPCVSGFVPASLLSVTTATPARGVLVVSARGELDAFTVPVLRAAVAKAAPVAGLVLDLGRVRFIAAAGLHVVEMALTRYGASFRVVAATRVVQRALALAELDDPAVVYRTVAAAVESLSG